MSGNKGREVLIKLGDGEVVEVFATIAGLQGSSISINSAIVDTTTKDSAGARRLLDGKILQSFSISGDGVTQDDASMTELRTLAQSSVLNNYQFVIPGAATFGGTYEGAFVISSFEETGAHDGAATFTATFESDGVVAFTPTPA